MTGCQQSPALVEGPAPPDFTLLICGPQIEGPSEDSRFVFILEPCGTLRAATGPGCTLKTYPESTAVLSREQVQRIYNKFFYIYNESQKPINRTAAPKQWYQLRVTADGERYSIDVPTPYGKGNEPPELVELVQEDPPLLGVVLLAMDLHFRSGLLKSEPFWDPDYPPPPPGLGNEDSAGFSNTGP